MFYYFTIVSAISFIFIKLINFLYTSNRAKVRVLELRDSPSNNAVQTFVKWLSHEGFMAHFKATEAVLKHEQFVEGNTTLESYTMPAVGTSDVVIRNRRVVIEREVWRNDWGTIYDTLRLSTRDGDDMFLKGLLDEARVMSETRPNEKLVIYVSDIYGRWNKFGAPRNYRPLDSVILDKGVGESLLEDLKEFCNSKDWYAERRIPYRRGYLLYGPPGCGKSSLVKALASELGYAVCVLNLSHKKMTDEALMKLMCVVPNRSFVLLEDVDAIFGKKIKVDDCDECDDDQDPREQNSQSNISFSGLLNSIDGIAAAEGRILFMTTNKLEKLDEALIRPGRADRRQLITYPTEHQLKKIFQLFYKEGTVQQTEAFVREYTAAKLQKSVAEIQGHFMFFKTDPEKAIQYAKMDYDPATIS